MSDKPKDILVITGGLVPPLVTETLYALADQLQTPRGRADFWPEHVIVAGTAANRKVFRDRGLTGHIEELCAAKRLPVPTLEVSVPVGDIEDVRTREDAEAFGTMMVRLIRRITADDSQRLHVSLAGGRKTMSFHAGVALSLYGRPWDRLSHALLDPPETEGAANFWYPTLTDLPLVGRSGEPVLDASGDQLNAKYVQVDLADIAYFSVRHLLGKDLLGRDLDIAEVGTTIRMALGEVPITLTLEPASRKIYLPGLSPIQLPPQEFAFFQVLCEWARDGIAGAGPHGERGNHGGWLSDRLVSRPQDETDNPVARYLEIYDGLRGRGSLTSDQRPVHVNTDIRPARADDPEAARVAVGNSADRREINIRHFGVLRSRLSKRLAAGVANPRVLDTLFQNNVEDDNGVRYGVNVAPQNISILEF